MSVLTVTSSLDDGSIGTLRQVISISNSGDTIVFNVPGNQVNLLSAITIGKQLRIDGTATNPNTNPFPLPFNGGPNVVINGGGLLNPFPFIIFGSGSDRSQLIDLSIVNFGGTNTIEFAFNGTLSNYTVRGCFFGLTPDGSASSPGGNIFNITSVITSVNNFYIGGPNPHDRNILIPGDLFISDAGILSTALVSGIGRGYGNLIFEGNYVGIDKTGENSPIVYANGIDFTANNLTNFNNSSSTQYSYGIIRKNLFGGMTRSTVTSPGNYRAVTGIGIKLPFLSSSAAATLQTILIEDNIIGAKWHGESLASTTPFSYGISASSRFTRIIGNQIVGAGNLVDTDTSANLFFFNFTLTANTAGSNNFVSSNKIGVNKDGTRSLGGSRFNINSDLYRISTLISNTNSSNGNNIYVKNIIGGATETNINNVSHDLLKDNYIGISPYGENSYNGNLNQINNTQNNITVLAAISIIRENNIGNAINNIVCPTNAVIEKNRIFNGSIGLNIGAASFYQNTSSAVGECQTIIRDNCFSDHNIGILVKNVILDPPNLVNNIISHVCASVTIEKNKIENSTQTGIQFQAEKSNTESIYIPYIYGIIVQDNDLDNNYNSINFLNASYNLKPSAPPYQMVIIGGFERNRGNRIKHTKKGIIIGDSALTTDLWKLPQGIRILHNDIDAEIIGIDLGNTGISENIPTQTYLETPGPNNWQNKPVLLSLNKINKCVSLLRGQLCSFPYEDYIIQVFANDKDPTKYPNGKLFITQERVTSDEFGFASFEVKIEGKLCFPQYLTATATRLRTGDTSEFSSNSYPVLKHCKCIPIENIICERNPNFDIFLNAPVITVTATTDSGLNTLRQAIIDVNTNILYQKPTIINFLPNIGTIFLESELPAPLYPIKIDGQATSPNTAPAPEPFNGGPNVVIEAVTPVSSPGFRFISFLTGSDGSILKDLSIVKFNLQIASIFEYGIIRLSANNISVIGCYLGLYPGPNNQDQSYSVTGLGSVTGFSKILSGETLSSSAKNDNKIGGQIPQERNIIIGLSNTILIDGLFNNSLIEGNYVGVENTGTKAIPHMISMNFRRTSTVANFTTANNALTNQASVIIRKNLIGGGGSVTPIGPAPVSPVCVNFSGGYGVTPNNFVLPSLMIDNIIGATWDGSLLLTLDGAGSLLPGTISVRSISTNSTIYNNLIVNNSPSINSFNLKFEVGDGFNGTPVNFINFLMLFGHNLAIFNKIGINKDEISSLGNSNFNVGDNVTGVIFYNLIFNNTIGGATPFINPPPNPPTNAINILSTLNLIQGNLIGEKSGHNLNLIYPNFTPSTNVINAQIANRSNIFRDNLCSNANNNIIYNLFVDISNNLIKNSLTSAINPINASLPQIISKNKFINNLYGITVRAGPVVNSIMIIDNNYFKENTNYSISYNTPDNGPINFSNITFGSVIINNFFDESSLYDIYFFYNGTLTTTVRLFRMIFVGGFSEKDGNKFRRSLKGVVLTNAIVGTTNLSPDSITINYNSIENSDIGIDLGDDGPSDNHPTGTPGPNNWQNKPILLSLKSKYCSNLLSGILDSNPNETYTIQVFANKEFSADHPNGKVYITEKKVQTDSSGHVDFEIFFKGSLKNHHALSTTATRTYTGDTSEFSNRLYYVQ
jgi:hypothetical protein